MNILSRLRLRTKLALLLGLAALGLVAAIGVGASLIHQRMIEGRVAELSAVLDTTLSLAKGLEADVVAHRLTREQAMERMREDVHLIRFGGGDYVSVQDRDGIVVAHGAQRAMEGKPGAARDSQGRSVIQLARNSLTSAGKGVIQYPFPRPGETVPQPKIAAVANFAPWDALFLAGTYVDDLEAEYRASLFQLSEIGGINTRGDPAARLADQPRHHPLAGRLRDAMVRLAHGELGTDIPGAERRDEVGEMAAAVQVFKNSMNETEGLRAAQEAVKAQAAADHKAGLNRMADGFRGQGRLAGRHAVVGLDRIGGHRAVDDQHGGPEQAAGGNRRRRRRGGHRRTANRRRRRRGTDGFHRRDRPPGRAIVEDHRQSGGRREAHR